jgi:hypothetical protein
MPGWPYKGNGIFEHKYTLNNNRHYHETYELANVIDYRNSITLYDKATVNTNGPYRYYLNPYIIINIILDIIIINIIIINIIIDTIIINIIIIIDIIIIDIIMIIMIIIMIIIIIIIDIMIIIVIIIITL